MDNVVETLKPTWKSSNNNKDIMVENILKPTWKSGSDNGNVVENIFETNMKTK